MSAANTPLLPAAVLAGAAGPACAGVHCIKRHAQEEAASPALLEQAHEGRPQRLHVCGWHLVHLAPAATATRPQGTHSGAAELVINPGLCKALPSQTLPYTCQPSTAPSTMPLRIPTAPQVHSSRTPTPQHVTPRGRACCPLCPAAHPTDCLPAPLPGCLAHLLKT